MKRLRAALASAVLIWAATLPALANCERPVPVQFAAGTTATNLDGGIARGEIACLTVGARAGQRLAIAQRDRGEGNIVLQLYRPGWKIVPISDGLEIRGAALPGAEEGADAPSWSGLLPVAGTYLLVLGTTRGGGAYRMRIEIR
jgi:hypothetical protein